MNKSEFVDIINKEVNDFKSQKFYASDKVKFNQFEIVQKILLHQNNSFSKSFSGKRFFFNIGNSRIDTNIKKIDLDTKDIRLTTDEYKPAHKLLLQSEIKQFLKENNHGVSLNEIVETFVEFGNVVVKKDDDIGYKILNLSNLIIVDQTAETLEDTTVIEVHEYSPDRFIKEAKEAGWNLKNAQSTIDGIDEGTKINVYERYGEMSVKDFKFIKGKEIKDGDADKYIHTLTIASSVKPKKTSYTYGENASGYVLFIEEIKPDKFGGKHFFKPYREAHFDSYQGRWFRKGVREKLFDIQDRANVLANQIFESMKWTTLNLLWSSDDSIAGKNIFEAIKNGTIIQADNLNILPIAERNLSAYVNEWNKLMDLADREAQAFEVATGEGLPSGTTLGQVQIQTASVGEYFAYKREKLGLMLKQIFNEWVIPQIISDINKEHILTVSGDPEYMNRYFDMAVDGWIAENYVKIIVMAEGMITPEQLDMIKQMKREELMRDPETAIQIIKDYYKNIHVKCDVDITGEAINRQSDISNRMALLPYVANPAIMDNPVSRGIIVKIAADLGIDVSNYAGAQPQAQGQSVPAPQQNQQTAQQKLVTPVDEQTPSL